MKKYNRYVVLLGFVLSVLLLYAQQNEEQKNTLIGKWDVTQIETLYQTESGASYRDKNIEKDKMTKDIDLKLDFGSDQLTFIMQDGKNVRSVSYEHGNGFYTVTAENGKIAQYNYKYKGKVLIIEKSEENVSVFEEVTVPRVVSRFVLKRTKE